MKSCIWQGLRYLELLLEEFYSQNILLQPPISLFQWLILDLDIRKNKRIICKSAPFNKIISWLLQQRKELYLSLHFNLFKQTTTFSQRPCLKREPFGYYRKLEILHQLVTNDKSLFQSLFLITFAWQLLVANSIQILAPFIINRMFESLASIQHIPSNKSSFYDRQAAQLDALCSQESSSASLKFSNSKNGWSKKQPELAETDCSYSTQLTSGNQNSNRMEYEYLQTQHASIQHKAKLLCKNKSHSNIQIQAKANNSLPSSKSDTKYNFKIQNQHQMRSKNLLQQFNKDQPLNNMDQETEQADKQTPNTCTSQPVQMQQQRVLQITRPMNVSESLQPNNAPSYFNNENQKKMEYKQPLKSLYCKNRKTLIKWLKVQCKKLELTRQTKANAVYLMDSYYKLQQFKPNQFLLQALTIIVLSSKMNEKKVLYTETMAKNCCIDVKTMMQTEVMLLKFFKFRINPYNFAKIITEYMLRWDEMIKSAENMPLFLHQSEDSFLLYQQLFFLADNYLLQFKELLTDSIKIIFQKLLVSKIANNQVNQVLDLIFAEENVFARNQYRYVYQCSSKSCIQVSQHLQTWSKEFQSSKYQLAKKYRSFKQTDQRYAQFLNYQF